MTKEEIEAAVARHKPKAKERAIQSLPFASFAFMAIITVFGLMIPFSWPLLVFWWWRYYRQMKLFMEQKEQHSYH